MPRDYEVLWPHCAVKYLVLSTEQFIVFLDADLDVDWTTSKAYDEKGHQDAQKHHAVMNEEALLEATPCEGISIPIKIHFKRLLGEAVARSLDHDYKGAEAMLASAARYINARSQETSRLWYLSASSAMTVPFAILGIGIWIFRGHLTYVLGEVSFLLLLCAVAGSIGALFSVIGRTGRQSFDCSAGRLLHYMEGASRIWAGAIAGLFVGLAVHSELMLSALAHGNRMPAVMMLAALTAGYGERLAKSLISSIDASGAKSTSLVVTEKAVNDE
ncbi:MAG: hypothetical protein ACLQUZ_05045 [Rhizomicrobium sp.]